MLGKGYNFDSLHRAWAVIWNMEVSPKVRHFLWRLCTGTLPTKALLKSRHMIEDASCPWCTNVEETEAHIIFMCSRVKELWEGSGCGHLITNAGSVTMCDLITSLEKVDSRKKQLIVLLAWTAWTERNAKVFENKATPDSILIARINRMIEDFGKYTKHIYKSPVRRVMISHKWLAPPLGVIKLNTDASKSESGWIGLGVVARDNDGQQQEESEHGGL